MSVQSCNSKVTQGLQEPTLYSIPLMPFSLERPLCYMLAHACTASENTGLSEKLARRQQ